MGARLCRPVASGDGRLASACSRRRAAWSPDEGDTWSLLPSVSNFWAVGFASQNTGWLVGGAGTILKIEFSRNGEDEDGDDENHAN